MLAQQVLIVLFAGGIASQSAVPLRVCFVNLDIESSRGQRAIDQMKARPAISSRHLVGEPGLRIALEGPVPRSVDPGETASDRARSILRGAEDAFAEFNERFAVAQIAMAEAILVESQPSEAVRDLLVDILVLRGEIEASRGNIAGAMNAFRMVHRIRPSQMELDPALHRPGVVKIYAKAVLAETSERSTHGRVLLRIDPPDARLWVDFREVYRAKSDPFVSLSVGAHYVTSVREGFVPKTEIIRVANNTTIELVLSLAPLTPEQVIVRTRRRLLALGDPAPELQVGARALARAIPAKILVFVWSNAIGNLQVAVYDDRTSSLGEPFLADDLDAFVRAVSPDSGSGVLLGASSKTVGPSQLPTPIPASTPGWSETWLGTSALIVGGALILGAGVFLTAAALGSSEDILRVDTWCIEPGCVH